jgi:hypothetical protein
MSWIYNRVEFTPEMIPDGAIGFVYLMSAIVDGKSVLYIGKKNFYTEKKTKLKKTEKPNDKRMKDYKLVKKLNYQNYFSSNDVLKEAHKKGIQIKREILHICYSKTELTYMETKLQFVYGVLENSDYLNGNILGKFYKQNGKLG